MVKKKESGDIKKNGRLSIIEMDYIRNNIKELGAEEVAKELNRNVFTVEEFAKKCGIAFEEHVPELEHVETLIANEFKTTPEWEAIKEEFNEKELKYFLYKYSRYVAQFKDDVLPTEENQIFQAIKFELLMRRNLRAVKRSTNDVRRMENEITKLYAKYDDKDMPDQTKQFVMQLENQILSARAAMGTRTTEFIKLQEKYATIMKELKATRDQRVSKIENSSKDVLSLLKKMTESKFRESEGRQQSLVNMAVKKEKARLGDYHTYSDGSLDRQILSVETMEMEHASPE